MRSLWTTMRELFDVLPRGAKPFYTWYAIGTALLAILDTVALVLIMLLVTPLVSGVPSSFR
ncbi:hypothetical protein AB3K78_12825 [Leucobacter sp. HNU]|uniref:hypothetical protein n=1 Tax=Leucobacter sp. HNU TaxID=3236805 RepID=UPI003A806185